MRKTAEQEMVRDGRAAVVAWLEGFAAAVRSQDFAGGRAMFAPDAIGFGTVAAVADGLDRLETDQWRRVWTVTRGFTFDVAAMRHGGCDAAYWVAVPWSSWGRDASGREFERRGRATIVLQREGERLVSRHTHFSFTPAGDADRRAGPRR